jgi:hypothetical protein
MYPAPVHPAPPEPEPRIVNRPPPALEHTQKMNIRAAAFRATRLYPGPVGQLISRELLAAEEFGYLGDSSGLTRQLVEHVMDAPMPGRDDR